ncbi:MAG: hypothetical protein NUW01_01695 [Gemmatimonadaceae bacterium]|nr:hypothetical protein [Gemmatimonadaceae bacterium]
MTTKREPPKCVECGGVYAHAPECSKARWVADGGTVERHEIIGGERPYCIGQWCCGCDEHPIGKPWGWNWAARDDEAAAVWRGRADYAREMLRVACVPRMTVLGFTGTQGGLTEAQEQTLRRVLAHQRRLGADRLLHGCCVGADDTAARAASELRLKVVGLPSAPLGAAKRSDAPNDVEFAPRPPLDRNRVIARSCDMLVACPRQTREVLRSGTWATVRYARRAGKPVLIIWPDGTTSDSLVPGGES